MAPATPLEVANALYAAGHHLLAGERIGEAAEAFRALVVRAERDERGWLGLAACHQTRGELRLALGLLEVGSSAAGNTARLMLARTALLGALGDDGAAERLLQMARERATGDETLEALVIREEKARS